MCRAYNLSRCATPRMAQAKEYARCRRPLYYLFVATMAMCARAPRAVSSASVPGVLFRRWYGRGNGAPGDAIGLLPTTAFRTPSLGRRQAVT